MSEARSPLKPVFRIDFPPGDRLGHGKIELMALIAETGSISAAGRAMDMSYRRAWLLVDALNRMFTQPVIESQRGGKQGGGASLTTFGTELLDRYRGMEKRIADALRADIDWLEKNRNPDAAVNRD
ncbi:ModE Family Transcriptional Regulator [Agrobacterium tumefaciens]|uniref:Transcriptional regulator n=1 Tax=Agrobacterium tumefaciens TaxID=358 RepID=A0A176XFY2_AGRTU|nr:winged helix-turn-helix domain-containing protein [Agrobacterium tumefaciens]OAE47569.1 transcriptional regulator [Agrobacterium tumefaciens]QTK80466.1 ModE Family Transcriptional Regulator [Agrobacterium tumefaciens]